MKKLSLRILTLILSLIMVLSAFVGCDKGSEGGNEGDEEVTTEPSADANAPKTIDVSEFTIVHAKDEVSTAAAQMLKEKIREMTKAELTVTDTYTESDSYKILIGDLGLDMTKDFFAKDEAHTKKFYEVIVQDNLIAIAATNQVTAESACTGFIEAFFKRGVATIEISDDKSFVGDFYGHETIGFNARRDEGDIRLVTFNIAYYIDVKPRVPAFRELFELFDADVLLLQEANGILHHNLDPVLTELGYTEAPTNYEGIRHDENWNPIYYRNSTVELVSSELKVFEYVAEGKDPSTFTLAELKVKETGKIFSCVSAHFSTDSEMRTKNALEFKDIAKEYQTAHNDAPFFLLGDLNCQKNRMPLANTLSFMTHATAMKGIVTKNMNYGTSATGNGWPEEGGPIIDHAYGLGNGYVGKQYQIVPSALAASASDHLPVIFDFELK